MTESVKVVVRCRPFVEKETKMGCKSIIEVDKKISQISITKPDETDIVKSFRFDEVFDENSTQQQIYDEVAFSLVESVTEGYNGNHDMLKMFRDCVCIWINRLWQDSHNDRENR